MIHAHIKIAVGGLKPHFHDICQPILISILPAAP
jgi:hypothetical protein